MMMMMMMMRRRSPNILFSLKRTQILRITVMKMFERIRHVRTSFQIFMGNVQFAKIYVANIWVANIRVADVLCWQMS